MSETKSPADATGPAAAGPAETGPAATTHQDLMPKNPCPSFLMKHILTHSMADEVHDDRNEPGDGYFWCARTCTPVGPDDELVTPGTCCPGRSCYDGPTT